MSYRHSSSISSEDQFIDRRLRSYRNPYYLRPIHSVNRHDEFSHYFKDKYRRHRNKSKLFDVERSPRDFISESSDSDTEEEIEYYWLKNHSSSRKNRYSHSANDIYQACHVTIHYTNDSSSSKNDQIVVKQKQNNEERPTIVYKGYLKSGETFSFKSQHLNEYPFDIELYVNGYFQTDLITCCEYKYRRGGFRLNHLFRIQLIEKSFPCQKCRKYRHEQNGQIIKTKRKTKPEKTNDDEEQTNQIQPNDQNSEPDQKEDKEEEQEEEEKTETPKTEGETTTNSANPLQMLAQRQATGSDDSSTSGGFFQSILAYLQQGLRKKAVREPLPPRHQGNVENFVVLLGGITDQSNLIGSLFNFIKTFENVEELKTFVDKLTVEKTILVLNDSFSESIEDYSLFDSIYLLSNESKTEYPNLKSISDKLVEELSNEKDLFSIKSVSSNETENQEFTYSQLLKETMLTQDDEGNLKKDFLDYCRYHYQQNQSQLKIIDELEQNFNQDKSISWFTKNTFLKKMIYRALRTEEVDILFKIRWIIQAINQRIKQNSFSQTVYRIFHLSEEKFNKFKENTNGLISFGTFLDCSSTKPSTIEHVDDMKTILFEIETTNGIDIKQIRDKSSNIEILLSFDNIYQIQSIDEDSSIIHLILIDKENEQFKQLTDETRSDVQGPVILIQLAKLLLYNDDYLHTDYFARSLFDDNSLKDNPTLIASLAAVHHLLGSQDHRANNHRAARIQFEQSLRIFLTFVPEDNQILSATYNNIGSMFYQEDEHDQAIAYHKKALQCQLKATTPDIEAIATYSGNIGAVYLDQKKYDEALANYKRSLHILQQSIPGGESLSIAMTYDRIAAIYWRMDKPEDALPFYKKALELELKFLPDKDHKISVSYFNLSTAYAKLNQLDNAIDCAEKSIQQLLKSVPPDHPEVKENTEQLEGLRRKKWLQQLYQ